MRASDEERREVANSLRRLSGLDYCKDPRYAVEIASDAVGADHFHGGYSWDKLTDRLAELIEPEPERTCHVDIHAEERNGRYVWVYTFSCGHEFESYWYMNPRYCPFCGAKVVYE